MADQTNYSEPALPPRLADDLVRLQRGRLPDVPPALDAEILREARAGYARRRRFWVAARTIGAAAAAAAAAVVAVVLYLDRKEAARPPVAGTQTVVRGDVDGNGRVDMLDAYLLAKQVDGKSGATAAVDLNGDGVTDRRDVDAVAAAAVRL